MSVSLVSWPLELLGQAQRADHVFLSFQSRVQAELAAARPKILGGWMVQTRNGSVRVCIGVLLGLFG